MITIDSGIVSVGDLSKVPGGAVVRFLGNSPLRYSSAQNSKICTQYEGNKKVWECSSLIMPAFDLDGADRFFMVSRQSEIAEQVDGHVGIQIEIQNDRVIFTASGYSLTVNENCDKKEVEVSCKFTYDPDTTANGSPLLRLECTVNGNYQTQDFYFPDNGYFGSGRDVAIGGQEYMISAGNYGYANLYEWQITQVKFNNFALFCCSDDVNGPVGGTWCYNPGDNIWCRRGTEAHFDTFDSLKASMIKQEGDVEVLHTDVSPVYGAADPYWTHNKNGKQFNVYNVVRYVDLDDEGAATGNDGASEAAYWNVADLESAHVITSSRVMLLMKGGRMFTEGDAAAHARLSQKLIRPGYTMPSPFPAAGGFTGIARWNKDVPWSMSPDINGNDHFKSSITNIDGGNLDLSYLSLARGNLLVSHCNVLDAKAYNPTSDGLNNMFRSCNMFYTGKGLYANAFSMKKEVYRSCMFFHATPQDFGGGYFYNCLFLGTSKAWVEHKKDSESYYYDTDFLDKPFPDMAGIVSSYENMKIAKPYVSAFASHLSYIQYTGEDPALLGGLNTGYYTGLKNHIGEDLVTRGCVTYAGEGFRFGSTVYIDLDSTTPTNILNPGTESYPWSVNDIQSEFVSDICFTAKMKGIANLTERIYRLTPAKVLDQWDPNTPPALKVEHTDDRYAYSSFLSFNTREEVEINNCILQMNMKRFTSSATLPIFPFENVRRINACALYGSRTWSTYGISAHATFTLAPSPPAGEDYIDTDLKIDINNSSLFLGKWEDNEAFSIVQPYTESEFWLYRNNNVTVNYNDCIIGSVNLGVYRIFSTDSAIPLTGSVNVTNCCFRKAEVDVILVQSTGGTVTLNKGADSTYGETAIQHLENKTYTHPYDDPNAYVIFEERKIDRFILNYRNYPYILNYEGDTTRYAGKKDFTGRQVISRGAWLSNHYEIYVNLDDRDKPAKTSAGTEADPWGYNDMFVEHDIVYYTNFKMHGFIKTNDTPVALNGATDIAIWDPKLQPADAGTIPGKYTLGISGDSRRLKLGTVASISKAFIGDVEIEPGIAPDGFRTSGQSAHSYIEHNFIVGDFKATSSYIYLENCTVAPENGEITLSTKSSEYVSDPYTTIHECVFINSVIKSDGIFTPRVECLEKTVSFGKTIEQLLASFISMGSTVIYNDNYGGYDIQARSFNDYPAYFDNVSVNSVFNERGRNEELRWEKFLLWGKNKLIDEFALKGNRSDMMIGKDSDGRDMYGYLLRSNGCFVCDNFDDIELPINRYCNFDDLSELNYGKTGTQDNPWGWYDFFLKSSSLTTRNHGETLYASGWVNRHVTHYGQRCKNLITVDKWGGTPYEVENNMQDFLFESSTIRNGVITIYSTQFKTMENCIYISPVWDHKLSNRDLRPKINLAALDSEIAIPRTNFKYVKFTANVTGGESASSFLFGNAEWGKGGIALRRNGLTMYHVNPAGGADHIDFSADGEHTWEIILDGTNAILKKDGVEVVNRDDYQAPTHTNGCKFGQYLVIGGWACYMTIWDITIDGSRYIMRDSFEESVLNDKSDYNINGTFNNITHTSSNPPVVVRNTTYLGGAMDEVIAGYEAVLFSGTKSGSIEFESCAFVAKSKIYPNGPAMSATQSYKFTNCIFLGVGSEGDFSSEFAAEGGTVIFDNCFFSALKPDFLPKNLAEYRADRSKVAVDLVRAWAATNGIDEEFNGDDSLYSGKTGPFDGAITSIGAWNFNSSEKYVDLSDKSPANPTHDGSESNPWNYNDIITGSGETNSGATIYVKGFAEFFISPVKFRNCVKVTNWGDNNAWGAKCVGATVNFVGESCSIIERGIISQNKYETSTTFNSCVIGLMEITRLNSDTESVNFNFNNCTVVGLSPDVEYLKFTVATGSSNLSTFDTCLFINAGVDRSETGGTVTPTINNCGFIGTTQTQALPYVSGYVVNNTQYEESKPSFVPTTMDQLLSKTGKDGVDYTKYAQWASDNSLDAQLLPGINGSGVKPGLFGGVSTGRGGMWFRGTVYVNVGEETLPSGTGTQINPIGVLEFNNYVNNGATIANRRHKEGDSYVFIGDHKPVAGNSELKFPDNTTSAIEYFGSTGKEASYTKNTYKAEGVNPVVIDSPQKGVRFGSGNFIERAVILQDTITESHNANNEFLTCVLFNENSIKAKFSIDNEDGGIKFTGSTILAPFLDLEGAIVPGKSALDFDKSYLYGSNEEPIAVRIAGSGNTESKGVAYLNSTQEFNGTVNIESDVLMSTGDVTIKDGSSVTVNGSAAAKSAPGNNSMFVAGSFTVTGDSFINKKVFIEDEGTHPSMTLAGKVGIGVDGDVTLRTMKQSTINIGETFIADKLTWDQNYAGYQYNINANGNVVTYNPSSNPASYYSSKLDNAILTPSDGAVDAEAGSGVSFLSAVPPIVNEDRYEGSMVSWASIKATINSGEPSSNILSNKSVAAAYEYCRTNNLLVDGYAVIGIDETVTIATKDSLDTTFNDKIIIVNNATMSANVAPQGYTDGYYKCGATSSTVIINNGLLEFGSGSNNFRGYIHNNGMLAFGTQNAKNLNLIGAINDVSNNATRWGVPDGSSTINVTYSEEVMVDISNSGVLLNSGFNQSSSVAINLNNSRVRSTKGQFENSQSNLQLFYNDTDSFSSIPSSLFPTNVAGLSDKTLMDYQSYKSGNSLISDGDLTVDALWNDKERVKESVGAFYYGDPRLPKNYYVDLETITIGDGTEVTPLSRDQFKSYLQGDSQTLKAVSGDKLYVRGAVDLSLGSGQVYSVSLGKGQNIDILPWNLETYGPWSVKAGILPMFNFTGNNNDSNINISGMLYTGSGSNATVIMSSAVNCNITLSNSVTVSDNDLTIVKSQPGESSEYELRCCTIHCDNLVIGSTPSSETRITIKDSAIASDTINTDNTNAMYGYASIINSETATGSRPRAVFYENVTLGNPLLLNIPRDVSVGVYNRDNFIFGNYGIDNPGSGSATWVSWGLSEGLHGLERVGIGAFYYTTTDRKYWVNLEATESGTGSMKSPLSYNQLKNYFDPSAGVASGIKMGENDTFYVKGRIKSYTDTAFLNIGVAAPAGGVSIKLESEDVGSDSLWGVEMLYQGNTASNLITSTVDVTGYTIDIGNMLAICSDDKTTYNVSTSDNLTLTMRSSMIYAESCDVTCAAGAGATNSLYGCTIAAKKVILNGSGDFNGKDLIIKAGEVA